MPAIENPLPATRWQNWEKILFRFFFIYFLLQAIPLDWKFYREFFSIDWLHLRYGDIFNLAHYSPVLFHGSSQDFGDWAPIAFIAVAGTAAWTLQDGERTATYDKQYYWIRVIARYRLAIGIIAYGFIKLFPLLAPFPSLSNLNTDYGDYTRWKLFSLSLGIVPSYESFLGLVEIIAGLLLFYRRSASVGAFIILIFLGNVFMSNLAYGGGELVYSAYLISLGLLVLSFDLRRLVSLLIFRQPTEPNRFRPVFAGKGQRNARLALKTAFIFFFVVLYGFKTRSGYQKAPYQFSLTRGLEGAAGLYNVVQFRINKDTLAFSRIDPVRWQDVVFEKWNTVSIRSNRTVLLDSNNVERLTASGDDRDYELEGTAGRHYYSYETDTLNHVLTLTNKNSHYRGEKLILHYSRPDHTRIILTGIDQDRDSVYVVLDKVDKKYLLEEAAHTGRQGILKL